ncbi:MAG: hypothetical protein K2H40_09495 [Lachnospiraceae bacterium]|nr:hypothetical protein [Lachnospiraceae bacterium]
MIKIELNEGKLPWVVGIGTILAGILFGVLVALYPNDSGMARGVSYLVILLIISMGGGMCFGGFHRKMTVEDRTLCYTNRLGRQKTFSLDEIGYCKAALEDKGGRDYLKLYDLRGEKLCKLEFGMKNSALFLQYLLDNQVKVECSEKSENFLLNMVHTETICVEAVPDKVNACCEEARALVREWTGKHREFGVDWKMGIALYLEDTLSEKKQLWEQEGCTDITFQEGQQDKQIKLPEGYLIAIEGYLQKDEHFVFDKKNRAVLFYVPVVGVSRSMQAGEEQKIRLFGDVIPELAEQLAFLACMLPRNRYHTEKISINHELFERL